VSAISEGLNELSHNLLYKPALTEISVYIASGWRMVTAGETEPQEDVTSKYLGKEGKVTHQ
jgi:hypothetical protein